MMKLLNAGFDYKNCRNEKRNDDKPTYYFERTEKLNDYLESTARV